MIQHFETEQRRSQEPDHLCLHLPLGLSGLRLRIEDVQLLRIPWAVTNPLQEGRIPPLISATPDDLWGGTRVC